MLNVKILPRNIDSRMILIIYKEVKGRIAEIAMANAPNSKMPSRDEMGRMLLVSKATVNRAISELIEEGVLYSEKGSGTYVADHATNGLLLRRDEMDVAVLLPNIMQDTYPGVLRGIEDVMHENCVNVVICNTDDDLEKEESYMLRLNRSHISGIIMIPTLLKRDTDDTQLKKMLLSMDVPMVFCNRDIPGMDRPLVTCNNYYGGYLATEHLIRQGYNRIAYLSSEPYKITEERFQGYQAAHWQNRREIEEGLIHMDSAETSYETGYYAMKKLLEEVKPDAVFCFNDRLACGAMDYLQERDIQCGRDFGVIGYDNTAICERLKPGLSSVSFEEYENGRLAAKILLERIRNDQSNHIRLLTTQPRLFVRGSTSRD